MFGATRTIAIFHSILETHRLLIDITRIVLSLFLISIFIEKTFNVNQGIITWTWEQQRYEISSFFVDLLLRKNENRATTEERKPEISLYM